jgi:hypothetical protein
MAAVETPRQSDADLKSIGEARALARRAREAQAILAELDQPRIDAIVQAMAEAVTPHAEALARLAVEETGYGVAADKVQKNLFSSQQVYEFIRPMKTVGVVNRIDDRKIVEIAEPFGVVAAIVPSTNPTSTAIYKILIALKARCAIVISPHPSAVRCITRAAEIMAEAATRAGAPAGAIGWMTTVTLEGTQELMKAREVAVILATGGMGLVRAAYSAGKPAYGVGPGNAPCYIESSADLAKAASDILTGKAFDNGLLCSSPNSVVVDRAVDQEARRQFQAQGGHFLSKDEADRLAALLVTPQRLPNPALVGRTAAYIAERQGSRFPTGHACSWPSCRGWGAITRSRSRSSARCCRTTSSPTGARGASAARRSCATAAWATPCPSTPERGGHPGVRPAQAGVPDLRQHVHVARIHRADDRARPRDDARLRRLRRQHHVRQHLAQAPAQHQAARVRDQAASRPAGRLRPGCAVAAEGAGNAGSGHHPGRGVDAAHRPVSGLARHRVSG